MRIPILGDIHGKWKKANAIINHEAGQGGYALSTGDLCSYTFQPEQGQQFLFCHGNHEAFQYIKEIIHTSNNGLRALAPGKVYEVRGLTVAALPGVFSPHCYEVSNTLKYYTRADLEKTLAIRKKIDVFLSHEAPQGVGVKKNGKDLGKEHLNQVIHVLQPRMLFFGHHHGYYDAVIENTRVLGTDQVHHSYLLLNPADLSVQRIKATLKEKEYRYLWEDKV